VADSCATTSPPRPSALAEMAVRAAARPWNWQGVVRYDPAKRWYLRLTACDDFEVWLLSWLPGQSTGFHDHGPSSGAFTVVLGTLVEQSAAAGQCQASGRTLPRGAVRSFGPAYVHDVRNDSAGPAVSVHVYSPRLTSMRRFGVSSGGLQLTGVEAGPW
jgi:predicted metal-dependent enzyme (double-stranded beta helix superfamily)